MTASAWAPITALPSRAGSSGGGSNHMTAGGRSRLERRNERRDPVRPLCIWCAVT